MKDWRPDIFEFVDYRAFLQSYYDSAKAHSSAFSYRYLARRAGVSSPSFLRHIMRGERNIGATGRKIAKALELNAEETEFFLLLVDFDQAETSAQKNAAFEKIAASRRFRSARRLDRDMFQYLSHWYYPAIREMVARPDFREDPEWIAGELCPSVPTEAVTEALEVLLELGLVVRRDGALARAQPSVTTEHEVRSLAIGNYHRQMLERASDSIESIPREHRDLGAMTACVSRATLAELKARIHEFRELVFELCESDVGREVVIQFNTQLFPLSRIPAEPS